jgi:hypothetical protein
LAPPAIRTAMLLVGVAPVAETVPVLVMLPDPASPAVISTQVLPACVYGRVGLAFGVHTAAAAGPPITLASAKAELAERSAISNLRRFI